VNIFDVGLYVYIRMISFVFLGSLLYVLLGRCLWFVFGGHLGISEVARSRSDRAVSEDENLERNDRDGNI
jgi:hypothetical protein